MSRGPTIGVGCGKGLKKTLPKWKKNGPNGEKPKKVNAKRKDGTPVARVKVRNMVGERRHLGRSVTLGSGHHTEKNKKLERTG